jgi:hypothetical protein
MQQLEGQQSTRKAGGAQRAGSLRQIDAQNDGAEGGSHCGTTKLVQHLPAGTRGVGRD